MSQIQKIYNIYKECSQKICTDTRDSDVKNSIFFGIKGVNFNGNLYAEKALAKGAKYSIITSNKPNSNPRIIHVTDTVKTLQQLAKIHRKNFNIPIISITGSNGKTTTKEILYHLLSTKFSTCCTKGNYNNHIGVPLTVLSLNKNHEIGIVELGANHIGEIDLLCQIAQPNNGLITNIGKAHLEGFGSYNNIIKAKSELYNYIIKNNGNLFVDQQNTTLLNLTGKYKNRHFYNVTTQPNSKFPKKNTLYFECNPFLNIKWDNNKIQTKIIGEYNAKNIAAAIKIAKYFNVEDKDINNTLSKLQLRDNRSEFIKTETNKIILDAYNANPTSTIIAINNFIKIKNNYPLLKHILIVGDMLELGEESVKYHQEIIDLLVNLNVKNCYLVGSIFKETSYPNCFIHSISVKECSRIISQDKIKNSFILIKGSRKIRLEKLTDLL